MFSEWFSQWKIFEMLKMIEGLEFEKEIKEFDSVSFLQGVILQLKFEATSTKEQIALLKNKVLKFNLNSVLSTWLREITPKNCDLEFFMNYNALKCPLHKKYIPIFLLQMSMLSGSSVNSAKSYLIKEGI